MLLLDRALRRESGGANNPEGLGGRNRKTSDIVNVDNIHSDKPDRPSGTSSAAGLRRLEKEATSGNGIAQAASIKFWRDASLCTPPTLIAASENPRK
jgi:hypothetical protein